MLRPVALFFALFGFFTLVRGDAIWWIDVRFLPPALGAMVLMVGCAALAAFAYVKSPGCRTRRMLAVGIASLAAICLLNASTFYLLLARGTIHPTVPIPLSLTYATLLAAMAWRALHPAPPARRYVPAMVFAACAILFPLAQMAFFGCTDYRRAADVAVVFGARAYSDGRPSDALADRVHAACDLYHRGLVSTLIFSGGPGDGAIDEPHAMRHLAIDLGVPADAIVLDPAGLNTSATAANTRKLLQHLSTRRVLAVSHAYHLPRVKLAFAHAGIDAFTVPAPQRRPLRAMPRMVAREVAAWWAYLVFA